jgi:hypothetical protein
MGWIIAAIIGAVAGAVIEAVGNVQQAKAQAAADEQKAKELEELSKTGGYYDQQLSALALEFKDIEADRAAAMQVKAIDTLTLAEQGAQAKGSIAAGAGVGGLAQEGSVLKRGEAVQRSMQRGLAKMQLQYEDVQRGLSLREAQGRAQETLTEFQKETGLEEAAIYRDEAEWLKTWGVFLGIAGPVVGAGTQIASLDFSSFGQSEAT